MTKPTETDRATKEAAEQAKRDKRNAQKRAYRAANREKVNARAMVLRKQKKVPELIERIRMLTAALQTADPDEKYPRGPSKEWREWANSYREQLEREITGMPRSEWRETATDEDRFQLYKQMSADPLYEANSAISLTFDRHEVLVAPDGLRGVLQAAIAELAELSNEEIEEALDRAEKRKKNPPLSRFERSMTETDKRWFRRAVAKITSKYGDPEYEAEREAAVTELLGEVPTAERLADIDHAVRHAVNRAASRGVRGGALGHVRQQAHMDALAMPDPAEFGAFGRWVVARDKEKAEKEAKAEKARKKRNERARQRRREKKLAEQDKG